MLTVLIALAVQTATPVAPPAQPAVTTRTEADGSRTLVHQITIAAPPERVWQAVATVEGWRGWAVRWAQSAPGPSETFETSYDPAARPGAATNIVNRFLTRDRPRSVTFRTVRTPAGFPHGEVFTRVTHRFTLEPIPGGGTMVRLTGGPYPAGAAGDALLAFFTRGSSTSVAALRAHLEASVARDPLAPFDRLVGKTWRGEATKPGATDVDVARWERILGGKAVRITHSVNDGAYGGETIIQADREGRLVYHYFTTGGFSTRGSFSVQPDGTLQAEEAVEGHPTISRVRSTMTFHTDGSVETRSDYMTGGAWTAGHGFRYRQADPAALRWSAAR